MRAVDGKASGARTPQNCKANPGIILKSNISKMKVSVPKAGRASTGLHEGRGSCQDLLGESMETLP